ncbi:hypothetical protein QTP88_029382 [Uroleucon formosanum]
MNNSARNAGLVSPSTPNLSKGNLTSLSLSPSLTDKKNQKFLTPNHFAAFATNDSGDQEAVATSASNSLDAPPANQPHTVQVIINIPQVESRVFCGLEIVVSSETQAFELGEIDNEGLLQNTNVDFGHIVGVCILKLFSYLFVGVNTFKMFGENKVLL